MRTLLGERFAPITSSIGFLELPFDEAMDGLERWRRSRYSEVVTERTPGGPANAGNPDGLLANRRHQMIDSRLWDALPSNGGPWIDTLRRRAVNSGFVPPGLQ